MDLLLTVPRRVSPLFSYPLGDGMRTESYLSEDITWSRFIKVCSEEMRLRDGCVPELAWKFSDGRGSKEWITLQDEDSYKRMMGAGARRIRTRAKKESGVKDPDLGYGWRIDLKVRNKVERIEEEEDEEDVTVPARGKEKERVKKKKKRSKAKVPTKRKRSGQKKAFPSADHIPITTDIRYVFSPGRRLSPRHRTLGLEHQVQRTWTAMSQSPTVLKYRPLQSSNPRITVLGVQRHVWC